MRDVGNGECKAGLLSTAWPWPIQTRGCCFASTLRKSSTHSREERPRPLNSAPFHVQPGRQANMATVGVSNFGLDIARFPQHTMVVGDAHQNSSIRSESTQNLAALAQAARLPNAPSTQARIPTASSSNASTPTTQRASATRSRASSRSVPPNIPNPSLTHKEDPQTARETSFAPARQETGESTTHAKALHSSSSPTGIASAHTSVPPSPRLGPTQRSVLSFSGSGTASPSRIRVRDLSHIQSFASEDVLTRSRHGSSHSLRHQRSFGPQYEISAMPVTDIIEMVAGLLTKITTTNDQQHEHIHRHIPPPEGTAGLSQQSTSVLAFHGKNAPSITILSYLSRIHKYCPTTYEVFLSLLIYFDRMTEMVNSGSLTVFGDERPLKEGEAPGRTNSDRPSGAPRAQVRPSSEDHFSSGDSGLRSFGEVAPSDTTTNTDAQVDAFNLSHFFVVDSYNIHRLVIAGVTCASKFFSDVFYTNSRYAKVRVCCLSIIFIVLIFSR